MPTFPSVGQPCVRKGVVKFRYTWSVQAYQFYPRSTIHLRVLRCVTQMLCNGLCCGMDHNRISRIRKGCIFDPYSQNQVVYLYGNQQIGLTFFSFISLKPLSCLVCPPLYSSLFPLRISRTFLCFHFGFCFHVFLVALNFIKMAK